MKVKITKEQQAEIAKIRELISAHQLEQDKLTDGFIKSMNLIEEVVGETGSTNEEIIWDYIYNDSTWMVELE
jgi:hypothetical protein